MSGFHVLQRRWVAERTLGWILEHRRCVYLTADELLTAFAVQSVKTEAAMPSILMPVQPSDVFVRERHYYNRFLGKNLANPLSDAKQMVLFQNIPVTDSDALQQALGTIRQHCSNPSIARVHTAIHTRG